MCGTVPSYTNTRALARKGGSDLHADSSGICVLDIHDVIAKFEIVGDGLRAHSLGEDICALFGGVDFVDLLYVSPEVYRNRSLLDALFEVHAVELGRGLSAGDGVDTDQARQ
jgi:hypothetical protein